MKGRNVNERKRRAGDIFRATMNVELSGEESVFREGGGVSAFHSILQTIWCAHSLKML